MRRYRRDIMFVWRFRHFIGHECLIAHNLQRGRVTVYIDRPHVGLATTLGSYTPHYFRKQRGVCYMLLVDNHISQ